LGRRSFTLKAVIIDSSIFAKQPKKVVTNAVAPESKLPPKHNTIEIEGVTDVLTKYRARLREKNIYQNSLTRPSQASGDAQLLQQVKKTLQTLNDPNLDSPINIDMDAILTYITQRGLKLYITFFKDTLSSNSFASSYTDPDRPDPDDKEEKELLRALRTTPRPLQLLQGVEVDAALDLVLKKHKLDPLELIVLSGNQHVLSLSKTRNVVTCRYG
jgi:hypothetical protein